MAPILSKIKKRKANACIQQAAAALLLLRRIKGRKKRKIWVREVFQDRLSRGDYHDLIPKLRQAWVLRKDPLYVETFRMIPNQFDVILSLVEPHLTKQTTHLRGTISPAERLYITLRYLATGDLYRSISLAYRVGKSTVAEIIPEVCSAIWKSMMPLYCKPPTQQDMVTIGKDFFEQWNFPNCIGALDGKHIQLTAPPNSGSQYYNYKGHHSIVLMATCDAQYKFTYVDVGNYGRISDGGVFRDSPLGERVTDPTFFPPPSIVLDYGLLPYCFVGDDAFPLKENLMKPYPGRMLTKEKRVFNYRLSRARRCIENAFGILAARWRVVANAMMLLPENAVVVVKAIICLHNFLLTREGSISNRAYCPTGFADFQDNEGNIQEGEWRQQVPESALRTIPQQGSNHYSKNSSEIRDEFCKYFNGPGRVPWQDEI